jgi:hypothetical protein
MDETPEERLLRKSRLKGDSQNFIMVVVRCNDVMWK